MRKNTAVPKMHVMMIISIIALSVITFTTAQANFHERPKNAFNIQQKRSSNFVQIRPNDQIRNKKLQIASLVDIENVKFGLQLKATSERRMKVFRKWNQAELLNHINDKTKQILKLDNIQKAVGDLLALGASADEAMASVADHMNFEHMETTVKHALDPNYPSGRLPHWKATVAFKAEAEAKKLIKTLVDTLQASVSELGQLKHLL